MNLGALGEEPPPPAIPLPAESVSVGSARGWHGRTGRRFVGEGDDSALGGVGVGGRRGF